MASHVWYASYGSNLSRQRFTHYLSGGTPAGGRRHYPGARDRSAPSGDRPLRLPYRLRFGGASRTWGGGMAFLDTATGGGTLARMYRLTADQFGDVHAQENGGDADAADVHTMAPGQQVRAGGGNYPIVVCCGRADGAPIVTFTCASVPDPTPPAAAYLRTIAGGLAEAHGLAADGIVRYLHGAPAVRSAYEPAALEAIVREGVAAAMVPPPRHSSPS